MKNTTATPYSIHKITSTTNSVPVTNDHFFHCHKELQFLLVTNGSFSLTVSGKNYMLDHTHGMFINSNQLHTIQPLSEHWEYLSVLVAPELVTPKEGIPLSKEVQEVFYNTSELPEVLLDTDVCWQSAICSMLSELYSFYETSTAFAKEYEVVIRMQTIWLHLLRGCKDSIQQPSRSFVRKQRFMNIMLSFIHENYEKDLSLSDIYQRAGISQAECCRIFKQFIHTSPYEYLITYRLQKSMEFLHNSSLSINEIALRVGFHDCSHFIQQFKRFTKLTPKAYRNTKHMAETNSDLKR